VVRHDRVTRGLSEREYLSLEVWWQVKKTMRAVKAEVMLVFDDTLQEKPCTDESEWGADF
jgi:hypothetical protein